LQSHYNFEIYHKSLVFVKRYFSTGVNIILYYGLFSILFLWLPQLFTFRMFLLTIWPYYWDFQNLVLFWNPSIYISMNRLCLFFKFSTGWWRFWIGAIYIGEWQWWIQQPAISIIPSNEVSHSKFGHLNSFFCLYNGKYVFNSFHAILISF
jgi:hypothetical protein